MFDEAPRRARPKPARPAALAVALALAGCGGSGAGTEEDGAVQDGANGEDGGAGACPVGSVLFPDGKGGGECVSVGPQPGKYDELLFGSGDPFAGLATGYPPGVPGGAPLADCPKGTVPTFAASRGLAGEPECTPVGPLGCDPIFIDPETGLCSPKSSDCPEGSIPAFEHGCLDLDVDPETGLGCGEGPWGHIVESPGDVHVDPLADAAVADGTRQHPWPLVAQALGQVVAGGRIVLSKGLHPAGIKLTKAVTLEGACPSEVTLGEKAVATPFGFDAVALVSGAPSAVLRAVAISGPGVGVAANEGAVLTLDRIVLKETSEVGLLVYGAGTEVHAQGLLVEHTLPRAIDGSFGWAIAVQGGGRLVLESAVLRGNRDNGLFVLDAGTEVEAIGLLVEGTLPREDDGNGGRGIQVHGSGCLALQSAAVRENRDIGLVVSGMGTEVETIGLLVESTLPQESDGIRGQGVHVQDSVHVVLESAALRRNRDVGLFVEGMGTEVEASGLLVVETLPQESAGVGGVGIVVKDSGQVVLASAALRENREFGLLVTNAGTNVRASGLLVESTLPRDSDGTLGRAIGVQDSGHLALESTALRENRDIGLVVSGTGTEVAATRLLVRDTLPDGDGDLGVGIAVQGSGPVVLESAALRGNRYVGLIVSKAGTVVDATGLLVEGTLPQERDLTFGMGIVVLESGHVVLDSAALLGNHEVGLQVSDSDTVVHASGLLVEGTLPRDSDGTGGRGVGVQSPAHVVLDSTVLRENRELGLYVSGPDTEVHATGLLVEGTLPEESDGTDGAGVWLQVGGSLEMVRAHIRQSRMAGLIVIEGGALSLRDTYLEGTALGSDGQYVGLADGIVAAASLVSLERVMSKDNLRAGFVFDSSTGTAKGLVSAGNTYGLVVQGDAGLDVLDEVVLLDNAFDSNDTGSQLPVADEPLATPDPIAPLDR